MIEAANAEKAVLADAQLRRLAVQGQVNLSKLAVGVRAAVVGFVSTRRAGFRRTQSAFADVIHWLKGERSGPQDTLESLLACLPAYSRDHLERYDGPHLDEFGLRGSPERVFAAIKAVGWMTDPRSRKRNMRVDGTPLARGPTRAYDKTARHENVTMLVSMVAWSWADAHRHRKVNYRLLPKAFADRQPLHPFAVTVSIALQSVGIYGHAVSACNDWAALYRRGKSEARGAKKHR